MEISRSMISLKDLCSGLPVDPLPPNKTRNPTIAHAPIRTHTLTSTQMEQALKNALRYFPERCHQLLGPEFAKELRDYGHIYMYRFLPDIDMRAYELKMYPAKTNKAAAVMLMIMNNLDPKVAQFPEELITYGGNGSVFSNWAQFWLVMHYLSIMTEEQTLVMYSGHPLGLFPADSRSPRVIVTNGMVIPNYSSRENYDDMYAMGVTMYGQMTAGSYCYIGPQGIVHGTTITIMNAGRKYLGLENLEGRVLLTSGLGGMSGAQAKASVISGCVGVVAEMSKEALKKRHEQGWLQEFTDDLDLLVKKIREARRQKKATSIGYLGNVVDVWERLVMIYETSGEVLVDLASDQTSLHNPFGGGYFPVQLSYQESLEMVANNPKKFKVLVQESLRRQVTAINKLAENGLFFWDYGNAFLLEARRAGAEIQKPNTNDSLTFRYPSYVQDIMGDIFSLGFGPFRWVCTSGDPNDLEITDKIAYDVMAEICKDNLPKNVQQQYTDNMCWIKEAGKHKLVVGSQARILYSDQIGRIKIAVAFNEAVRIGQVKAPVVISRDHHDVSGTDSPFRETSNVYDGSAFTADMAVQNFVGDAFRGATWVSLHNGGGVGWGEVINGGFGLVLDGSEDSKYRATLMLNWDVSNGVARRSWSGNDNARATIERCMTNDHRLLVTMPTTADPTIVSRSLESL